MGSFEDKFLESNLSKKMAAIFFDKKLRIRFYEKLASLIENGKQLQSSVENLQQRSEKKSKTETEAIVFRDIVFQLRQGKTLGDTLNKYAPMGERMLILAGERSGSLPEALNLAASNIKAGSKMMEKIISAIVQPLGLLIVLGGALFVVSRSVVPKLALVYPIERWEGLANVLRMMAEFVDSPWGFYLAGTFSLFCIVVASTLTIWTGKVRNFCDKWPPWSFYRILQGSLWLLSFSSLIRSGTTVHESLSDMKEQSKYKNKWFYEKMDKTLKGINNGQNIGHALEATETGFPDPDIVEDLIIYSDLHDFDNTLYKMGTEFMKAGLEKIDTQAKILNSIVKILFGVSVIIFAGGIISVQMQISEYFGSMGM